MGYETLRFTVDADGVGTLHLSRPEQLNAFNVTMARELEQFFLTEARSDDVRAIVVTGEGRAFCAGMDLSVDGNAFGLDESLQPSPRDFWDAYDQPPFHDGIRDTGGRVTLAIHALPKPVIAAVNGAAVGIGATMTLAMDLRLAAQDAKFGFVFGRLGIVPEAASTWFLPRIVGLAQALEWAYAADFVPADVAHAKGLVRSVHPPTELLGAAQELAASFVRGRSAVALGLAKRLIYRNSGVADPLQAHLSDSLAMFYTSIADGREGVNAFKEKRAPSFVGKASELPAVYP